MSEEINALWRYIDDREHMIDAEKIRFASEQKLHDGRLTAYDSQIRDALHNIRTLLTQGETSV